VRLAQLLEEKLAKADEARRRDAVSLQSLRESDGAAPIT
jgi:hypothetical protein